MPTYFDTTHRFSETLELGNLRLKNIKKLGINELYFDADEAEATITLSTDTPEPWDGLSMVMISSHLLPDGKEEFERKVKWYSEDKLDQSLLPEGIEFSSSQLEICALNHFEHDAFAEGKRACIHTYVQNEIAIIVRFLSKKGTVLDNPLFLNFLQSIELTDSWESNSPIWEELPNDFEEKKPRKIELVLDLEKDAQTVLEYIKKRIEIFHDSENFGPGGDNDRIRQITLGYQFDQAGWFALVFDTRVDAEFDGEWTGHIQENCIDQDHWYEIFDKLYEFKKPVTLKDINGNLIKIDEYNDKKIATYFGDMLKQVIIKVIESGYFTSLPLTNKIRITVEEQSQGYYWVWEG